MDNIKFLEMDDTKILFFNVSSNYEVLNDPLGNCNGPLKIRKSSFNQTVQNSAVERRLKGDKNFDKCEGSVPEELLVEIL